MKRHVLLAMVPVLLLLFPAPGRPEPVEGPERQNKVVVDGGSPGKKTLTVAFEGGQRASVIVRAQRSAPGDVGLEVYDESDRLVASDLGRGDFATVTWYPPVTGKYSIHILNPSPTLVTCYVMIR